MRIRPLSALFVLLALLFAAPAAGAAPIHGVDAYFDYAGTQLWNHDQNITVLDSAPSQYWSVGGWYGSGDGYYMGLQTDGTHTNGEQVSKLAIFSVWNANGASGARCGTFGGEGDGYSCRLTYDWKVGRSYRLRTWRLNSDAQGQWWGAWVRDNATGSETFIGQIRARQGNTGITQTYAFTESFRQSSCSAIDKSDGRFSDPLGNNGAVRGRLFHKITDSCSRGWLFSSAGGEHSLQQGGTMNPVDPYAPATRTCVTNVATDGRSFSTCDGMSFGARTGSISFAPGRFQMKVGQYTAVFQSDGNLVVYGCCGYLWASNTANRGAGQLALQHDGNIVIYSTTGTVLWSTTYRAQPGSQFCTLSGSWTFVMQGDGNLVHYAICSSGAARAVWSSWSGRLV